MGVTLWNRRVDSERPSYIANVYGNACTIADFLTEVAKCTCHMSSLPDGAATCLDVFPMMTKSGGRERLK